VSAQGGNHFPHLLEVLPDAGDATKLTLELLWRAAPEQVEELDALFAAGIQTRILQSGAPTIGVSYNVLQVPPNMLRQLWLLSHAAWNHLLAFSKLKQNKDGQAEASAASSAITAAKSLGTVHEQPWPTGIPAFQETIEGVEAKAVRELYAMAVAWAIFHEMRHAKFFEDENRPNSIVEEEMCCDSYAADCLFDKITKYSELTGEPSDRVRAKRASAALVGLYYVATLSPECQGSTTHPAVRDRIKLLFDKIGDGDVLYFWDLAVALIWGMAPEIANAPAPLSDPSPRDLAYFALDQAFA
jgi:Peptidase U49